MNLKKRLQSLLSPAGQAQFDRRSYWVYVRCNRCGEILNTRIDLQNDLSIDYKTNEYTVQKVIVGSGENRCFQRITVNLRFDKNKRPLEIEAEGGEVVEPPQSDLRNAQ